VRLVKIALLFEVRHHVPDRGRAKGFGVPP
jgi:hypothetical protein